MSRQVETVMDIYAAFGQGDVARILDKLDDDIRLDQGIRSTSIPYLQAGTGKEHVTTFFTNLAAHMEFTVFEPGVICEGPDTVIVPIREAGRNRLSGGEIAEDTMIHMWTFGADGRVIALRHIGDWAHHERAAQPTTAAPPAGATLSVLSDTISVLQSGGEFEVFALTGPEDSGPPPHAHPWVEAFYVLEGAVEVTTDVTQSFEKGEFCSTPAGVVHSYRLIGADTRILVMSSGSHGSAFFADMDANLVPGAPTPESMPAVIDIAKRNGLTSPLFA